MRFFIKLMGLFGILSIITIYSCGNISLFEYVPKDRDEKEIIDLIIQYQDAKKNFDLDRLMACLHDDGRYNYECRNMVSKKELKASLPSFWKKLQAGGVLAYPMYHECFNADYFPEIEFINPQIKIHLDTAEVLIYYANNVYKRRYFMSLVKEHGKWLFSRLEYDPY